MDKWITRFFLIAASLFMLLICISSTTGKDKATILSALPLPQVVKAPDLNRHFEWAGEPLPMSADVKERLDVELLSNSYYHSSTIQYMKRANRYFPEIEQILNEYGIPDDFKYLAVAESGLLHATSGKSAKGFWQFRKLAAKEYGLEVNDEVDERFHVTKATRAACQYLKYLHKRFGSWTDAAAAYNVGPTAYAKQQGLQKETNYYAMNLNQQTAKYVFRIMAIKEIMSRPEDYGFYLDPEDLYPPLDNYYEVEVDASVANWGAWAHERGVTYRDIKRYNPWLRDNHLTVIKNKYLVKVPRV